MKILIISEVGWFFLRQRHHEVALYFSGLGHDVYLQDQHCLGCQSSVDYLGSLKKLCTVRKLTAFREPKKPY